jgi:hypothetical protein
VSEVAPNKEGFWKSRSAVITLCFFATFVCYIDRVDISAAIIPMTEEFGWDLQTQGCVLSSLYIGNLCKSVVATALIKWTFVYGMRVRSWVHLILLVPS